MTESCSAGRFSLLGPALDFVTLAFAPPRNSALLDLDDVLVKGEIRHYLVGVELQVGVVQYYHR